MTILMLMISCQKKNIEFYSLEKHSGEGLFDRGDLEGKKFAFKSVLVENPPKENEQIVDMFLKYKNNNLNDIYKDNDLYSLSVFFYLKNSSTSYFIDNGDDPGGFSSEVLQDNYQKYGLGQISIDRCLEDKKKWTYKISYFDFQRNLKDTILEKCSLKQ